jgi:DNA-binding LacI/PurR family transcriptional regulator
VPRDSTQIPATIHDVAQAAGVSVTTVSHALSGRGRVASATRERVRDTAEQLGYTANPHAQRLVLGRSRTLAIQIAGFTGEGSTQFLPDAAFYLDVLNGASSGATERDYDLVLLPYDLHPRRTQSLAIDGAVVVDPSGEELLLRLLPERGLPVVTVSRPTQGDLSFPWVDNDHRGMAVRVLDHLIDNGYSRPAMITTTRRRSYVADALDAYAEWSRRRGTEPIVVELPEPPDEHAAEEAARDLLTRSVPPDAVYATYERLALGVLRQARQFGLDVPEDLGVVSAVDGEMLLWVEPDVTAAFLNPRVIGHKAISALIDLTEDIPVAPGTVVSSRLVVRRSTQRRAGASRAASTA